MQTIQEKHDLKRDCDEFDRLFADIIDKSGLNQIDWSHIFAISEAAMSYIMNPLHQKKPNSDQIMIMLKRSEGKRLARFLCDKAGMIAIEKQKMTEKQNVANSIVALSELASEMFLDAKDNKFTGEELKRIKKLLWPLVCAVEKSEFDGRCLDLPSIDASEAVTQ